MLKFVSYDIVFQEVPNEVSLAINLSACPNCCKGCHSPHLQQDIGEILDTKTLDKLLNKYQNTITCVCFMGGDADAKSVERLSMHAKKWEGYNLKTAWYSGKPSLPNACNPSCFDYIKLGPYIEKYGGLDKPTTNQRFYKIEEGNIQDITHVFLK